MFEGVYKRLLSRFSHTSTPRYWPMSARVGSPLRATSNTIERAANLLRKLQGCQNVEQHASRPVREHTPLEACDTGVRGGTSHDQRSLLRIKAVGSLETFRDEGSTQIRSCHARKHNMTRLKSNIR